LPAFAQIKHQFGGASGLSHPVVLLIRTNILDASSVLLLPLDVKLFRPSIAFMFALVHGIIKLAPA